MKTSADKSSTTTSVSATQTAQQPFFAKAGGGSFFAPVAPSSTPAVQMKMTVNKAGDKFEQEADKMSEKVMRMPAPAPLPKEEKLQRQPDDKLQKKEEDKIQKAPLTEEKIQKAALPDEKVQKKDDEKLQKAPAAEDKLQRKASAALPAVSANVQSSIHNKTTGGQPLSADVRSFMEPRFGADFSNVRVHHDADSAGLSNELSARAFTYQNHVFFSHDQYQPGTSEGKQLLAHELTHTIQQGHAVQRSPQVSTTTTPPPIQRLGMDDALNKFAEWANLIPGFRMLTIIIGVNPINMQPTDRSAANVLRALIELVPIGVVVSQVLDRLGFFNKAGAWAEQQIAGLSSIGSEISAALRAFLRSLSWTDIFDLGGVWERAKAIFTGPVSRAKSFAESFFTGLISLVKEAVLRPLAAMAEGTSGYPLLKALLGQDPITGEPVPRNADTLIGGFMTLIGQQEIWENLKKGNAVARAWAWFQGALEGLLGFARSIPGQIIATITSLTWQDIVSIAGAFTKVAKAFLGIAGQFGSWALNQVVSLLEILFSVVAPGAIPYVAKARAAFLTIIKNPIAFVGNLVRAGKLGFQMFASNILTHLKTAFIRWLTGPLGEAGVYIPQSFALLEIVKLVLSVFGLTWVNIRAKLVKIIPEPVLVVLEKTASVLVTLVTQGPAAAWQQIVTELTELKDQMIAQITQMVTVEIVKAAVMKLVSMINPAGAVIQAILAIWNTVSFFISKLSEIGAVVGSFINSISAIAAGTIEPAAKRVEQTMANILPLVIGFLAKLVGLGGVPGKLVGIVKKLRAPIDKGLDKIVAWLGSMLKKLKPKEKDEKQKTLDAGIQEANELILQESLSEGELEPKLQIIKSKYKLKSLSLVSATENETYAEGEINPKKKTKKRLKKHPSAFVEIRQGKYVIKSVHNIRDQFYGKSFNAGVLAWRDGLLNKARNVGGLRHPTKRMLYFFSGRYYDRTISNEIASLDHKKPVSQHWNSDGRKTNQTVRKEFFNRISNLKIMPLTLNSSKGGESYTNDVTRKFRGPGE
jgi:hypothetical protein